MRLSFLVFVPVLLLLPPPAPIVSAQEKERAAILKRIQDSQRAGFERHSVAGYMSLWTKDVKIIYARSAKRSKYDMVVPYKKLEPTARLRFRGKSNFKMTITNPIVKITGNKATVRFRTTMRSPDSVEIVEEQYRLRKEDGVWRAYINRGWPVELTYGKERIRYTPETWVKLDVEIEKLRRSEKPGPLILALFKAWRFTEARDEARAWTKTDPKNANAWLMRGSTSVIVRDASDALASYRRARKLDPNAILPEYVELALRDK